MSCQQIVIDALHGGAKLHPLPRLREGRLAFRVYGIERNDLAQYLWPDAGSMDDDDEDICKNSSQIALTLYKWAVDANHMPDTLDRQRAKELFSPGV